MTLAEDLQFLVQLYRANSRVLLTPHCAMQYAAHPLRREADHFKQLLLQKEIAHWVITEQKHTEFKPFFRKKLSAYTAFSVFYAPDIGLDPIAKAKEIMEDEALCALLSEAELHGVFRCIVHCLKQQNLPALQLHLAAYAKRCDPQKLARILERLSALKAFKRLHTARCLAIPCRAANAHARRYSRLYRRRCVLLRRYAKAHSAAQPRTALCRRQHTARLFD